MRTQFYPLNCVTTDANGLGVGIGLPTPVRDLQNKTIQAGPGFTGAITIEGNIVGDQWTTLGTVAASAILYLNSDAGVNFSGRRIRANCTTATAGASQPACTLAADDGRTI